MKKCNVKLLGAVLLLLSAATGAASARVDNPSLVDVGPYRVTVNDLKTAIKASPFATQFVSMDEDDQASLRGDLLKRLVISRLLRLEAERQGLDSAPEFQREVDNFRRGLLYRRYIDRMRSRIALPEEQLKEMREAADGSSDVFEAMKAAEIAKRYRAVRRVTLESLIRRRHVVLHSDRIVKGADPETVVLDGDGLRITLGEVVRSADTPKQPSPEWIQEQASKMAELILISDAAREEGIDVSGRVESYRNERLPALLMSMKEKEWVPDESVLRAYYQEHPEIAHVAERRHIGMLVLPSFAQANAMRQRILAGESLFRLAGLYSIDPYGRAHNGDMGWVREGTGMPELEEAISKLEDNQVSEVIKTAKGYHIVTILERKAGEDRPFAGVRDKVRQAILNQKLAQYIRELQGRYKISWNLAEVPRAGMAEGK